ncbi:MAG: terminase large subunit [Oscillospiraceae bacterium]
MRKLKNYKPTKFKAKTSHYDKDYADYAVNFIESLCHTKGIWAGKKFELIDWQEQIIRDIFGTIKKNGYRQFNTAYIEIPKKQGKSEIAAAVSLLLTCGDEEEGAEVYSCAADKEQASIVFNVASEMVRMCPALAKRTKILDSKKRIIYLPTNSFYQVLSAEAFSKHGFNVHGVIFDELHAQPNRKLFDVMTKGSGDARMQPLFFLITTAGTDTNSICYEVHQKAKDIIEGRKHDPTFYPVIYGADENDDWKDPKVWKKANPSLGITVQIDKVRDACNSAQENPAEENAFRQLRLNQWVKQAVRWMPMDKWDKCAFAVDPEELRGRACYGGLDLSTTTDITAFVLVFPPVDDEDKYQILPFMWIPEEGMELRVRRDHVPYDLWHKQGYLETTEGNVIHYGYIEEFIEELSNVYDIREIAYDRWGSAQMVQILEGMGLTVVPFGQGFASMSPPTKELYNLVLEEKIAHGGHPVLRWMMDNVYVRRDPSGNIKPDKEKSTEKIDGAVAMIMGLDRALRCENCVSVYDSRGLMAF